MSNLHVVLAGLHKPKAPPVKPLSPDPDLRMVFICFGVSKEGPFAGCWKEGLIVYGGGLTTFTSGSKKWVLYYRRKQPRAQRAGVKGFDGCFVWFRSVA